MTNLKEVNFGLNQFCGPSVLSALTGKSTDECASVIMSITGRAEVRAVDIVSLMKAFEKLRFNVDKIDGLAYSLFGTLSRLSDKSGFYVVIVPHHVVAIEVTEDKKVYLVDNHSKSPLPAEGSARLSQKVQQIYKVTPKPEPVFIRTEIAIEKMTGTIFISAKDIYNDYDVNRLLGRFTFKSFEELKQIIEALQCLHMNQ